MKLISYFTESDGTPIEALEPIVKITNVNDIYNPVVLTLSNNEFAEIGDGFYGYDFLDYTEDNEYIARVDGGSGLDNIVRYQVKTIDRLDIIDAINLIKDVETGTWAIEGTQMVFYKGNTNVEIMRFNLFDSGGLASPIDVFKRERV